MQRLALRPNSEDYSQSEGAEVIGVALDGGSGRYRRDKINAAKQVNVSWTMNPEQFAYWRAFWHTATKRGSLPFLCDLVGEDGQGPIQHVCRFMPGSIQMPSQQGLTYMQQATLEVQQNPVDDEANELLMLLFESGTSGDIFIDLGRLVNETAPEALEAYLGDEINPDVEFELGTGWAAGAGWALDTAAGQAYAVLAATELSRTSAEIVAATEYEWELKVDLLSAGDLRVYAGTTPVFSAVINAAGFYSGRFTTTHPTEYGVLGNGFTGRIGRLSIREVL